MYVSVIFWEKNIILTPAVRKGFCQNSFATCSKTTFKSFQREVVDMLCDKNTNQMLRSWPANLTPPNVHPPQKSGFNKALLRETHGW